MSQSEADAQSEHFCDRACARAWLSTTQRDAAKWAGETNPNWRGGVDASALYGAGWPRVRRRALERDGHACQRCGVERDELGQNPDVHHIRPVRTFDAHTLPTLVSFCLACYLAVERGDATFDDE